MTLTINSTNVLRSGKTIPSLGFGVYQSSSAVASVTEALKAGYRHIDSARVYRNELEVVQATSDFLKLNPGEKVWLTSKVYSKEHGSEKTRIAVQESIDRAKTCNFTWDVFLLHDACSGPIKRLEAWKVLEEFKAKGDLKSIGVSNFSEKHLEEFKLAGVEMPEINQIELHPWLQQKPIVKYCSDNGIIVQAYCPIFRGARFEDPVLQGISKRINQPPANILLRWSLQKGYIPLPKSDTPSRIQSNRDLYQFELSKEDMNLLDSLDSVDGSCSWNPVSVV